MLLIFPMQLSNNGDNMSSLALDETKIAWHKDRINAWLNNKRFAPITIDCSLTRKCNYKCVYCYGQLQANHEERNMTKDVIFKFLDDCAEMGVKGISFVSDGESTCNPNIYDAIIRGKNNGIDMALGTNGSLLKKDRLEDILPALTYLRFNYSAAQPERYAEVMGTHISSFDKVNSIIRKCIEIKNNKKLSVTIGLQMVLLPEFSDQIIPLSKLGMDLGVDYLVIKHCGDDEKGTLGVKYDKYFELTDLLKKAETYSTNNYLVKAKWSKILSGGKRYYSECYGPPFLLQLSGSGLLAPCGALFNNRYKRYHIGNIFDISFKEMWRSDRYWEIMDLISSKKFDAKTMCCALCIQHKTNEFLWSIKNGAPYKPPNGEPPIHLNFI